MEYILTMYDVMLMVWTVNIKTVKMKNVNIKYLSLYVDHANQDEKSDIIMLLHTSQGSLQHMTQKQNIDIILSEESILCGIDVDTSKNPQRALMYAIKGIMQASASIALTDAFVRATLLHKKQKSTINSIIRISNDFGVEAIFYNVEVQGFVT